MKTKVRSLMRGKMPGTAAPWPWLNGPRRRRRPIGAAAFSSALIPLFALTLLLAMLSTGCATRSGPFIGSRPFDFNSDTFAYPNGLVWEYHFDAAGKWVHERRRPAPDYTQHCFVMARSARQFFQNARFEPAAPKSDDATYRRLIRRVVAVDPEVALPESERVVIPGYSNLRDFSRAEEALLKPGCGGAWESYFQRGHWRMLLPFSRASQARAAARLARDLRQNRPPVVHIVRFPQLTINHAVLLFAESESASAIQFLAYDPNRPGAPRTLTFDRVKRTFFFPANDYFPGGKVNVYEVYRSWSR